MVKLITGGKGTGKTKKMIEMANDLVANGKGHIVFIDDDRRIMYDLKHEVRFVSMDEYPMQNMDEFLGFICGVISGDHDIETIFIDGLLKIIDIDISHLPRFIKGIKILSQKFEIDFVISISCALHELPEELREYNIA